MAKKYRGRLMKLSMGSTSATLKNEVSAELSVENELMEGCYHDSARGEEYHQVKRSWSMKAEMLLNVGDLETMLNRIDDDSETDGLWWKYNGGEFTVRGMGVLKSVSVTGAVGALVRVSAEWVGDGALYINY